MEVLTQFNAEKPTEGYKLEGNVVEILADKNNRKLMGRLVCRYVCYFMLLINQELKYYKHGA